MATKRHIILTGMMGAVKTSVAEAIEAGRGVPSYETDTRVSDVEGLSIPEIFSQFGEPYFREQEAKALRDILDREEGVIATGGGIVGSEPGRLALSQADATIIWLEVDLETAWESVSNDPNRPLAQDFGVFEARFIARQPLYRSTAHFTINTEMYPLDEIVSRVTDYL